MPTLQERVRKHRRESVKYFVHALYYWFTDDISSAVIAETELIWHQQQQYFNEQKLKRGAIA
jgi:hypothetical protein